MIFGQFESKGLPTHVFPLSEGFSDSYSSEVKAISITTTYGLFSHPPYQVWMGGEMKPLTLKFTLFCGGAEFAIGTVPSTKTAEQLRDFVENLYKFAMPEAGKLYVPETTFSVVGGNTGKLSRPWFQKRGYITSVEVNFQHPYSSVGLPHRAVCNIQFTPIVRPSLQAAANAKADDPGAFKVTGEQLSLDKVNNEGFPNRSNFKLHKVF